jgi:hypothetical protein
MDLPMNSRINLVDPRLVDTENGLERRFSLIDVPLGLSQMVIDRRMLLTTGGDDPYLYWDMASFETSSGKLFFVCNVEETPPGSVVEKILSQSSLDVVEKDLLGRQEIEAAKLFRQLAEEQLGRALAVSFKDAFFEFFWKGAGEDFSKERKIRKTVDGSVEEEYYRFKVVFPVAARPEKMRIDLPDVQSKKYTFKTIELVGDGWSQQVDINSIDDRLSHMVARQGANFEVLGNDPYFVFPAPSGGRIIESVIIRGGAR